jgi:pimeloyl-ACP methyl ester carboxylesterase
VNLTNTTHALRVVVVPGIFDECTRKYVRAFSDGLAHLERHGWRTGSIPVSGRSGTAHNASQIRDFVLGLSLAAEERVLLVAYSKGAADTLEALGEYPEILGRVAAMVSVAGAIGGSPLADGYVHLYEHLLRDLAVPNCPVGDGQGMASITRAARQSSLAQRPPPSSVKYFSVAGIPGPQRISRALLPFYQQLAHVDPRNDGQVIFFDAIIPGGTLLGFLRADHWALAMPFSRNLGTLPFTATLVDHNAFPREVLLETLVRFVEEEL